MVTVRRTPSGGSLATAATIAVEVAHGESYSGTGSRSEWQRVVEQQRVSELPDREFCRRKHLTLGTFRWWKSQIRDAITAGPKSGSAVGSPAFLAVSVRDSAPATAEPGAVEILLQGDERPARIRADCPVELAVAVTAVLRGTSSCS